MSVTDPPQDTALPDPAPQDPAPQSPAPVTALLDAMHKVLEAYAPLADLLGPGRIHMLRPMEARPPCVTLGEVESTGLAGDATDGLVHRVTIYGWSRAAARQELERMLEHVVAALHDAPLELDGHALVNLGWLQNTLPALPLAADRRTWRGAARFRAATQPRIVAETPGNDDASDTATQ